MAVGVNAKIVPPLPEAAAAASLAPGGDGFALLLTGIAATPAGGAGGEVAATAPGVGVAPPAPAISVPAVAAAALTAMSRPADETGDTDKNMIAADSPREAAPAKGGAGVAELGDILARMLHVGRNFGRGAEREGEDSEAGEGEAEIAAGGETASDLQTAAIAARIPPTPNPVQNMIPAMIQAAVPAGSAQPAAATATVALAAPAPARAEATAAAAPAGTGTEVEAAESLDTGDFARLARPIELAQLRSTLPGAPSDTPAAGSPPPAGPMEAIRGSHATTGKVSEAPAAAAGAFAPASPAVFDPSAGQPLVQPQLAAGGIAAAAAADSVGADITSVAADLAVEHQLDIAQDGQWVDRLAKDIARAAGREGPLRFQLNPEALGRLHVELAQSQAGTTVRMNAETEAARAFLVDAQPRLIAEARAQGVRIAESHVGMNSNGHQADQRRQDDGRHQAFVRTGRGVAPEAGQIEQSAAAAAERFA